MERPLAIMFVDIADSTTLYERVGNAKAADMTRRVLFHLRLAIEVHGGGVIKTLGDGLLAAFPSADDAAWAAITMANSSSAFVLRIRVGLSHGVVIQKAEDIYGDACNVAARVQSMARPGEILATGHLVDQLSGRMRERSKLLSRVTVKGKSEPIAIHELLPDTDHDDGRATIDATTIGAMPPKSGSAVMFLHVSYRGREYTVSRQFPRLTIGREEACDMRISARQASRHHAQLDFSRESFILTDQSTNGTFIRTGASIPVALRRDSTKLVGEGVIGFGAEPTSVDEDHVAAYRVELRS